MLSKFYKNKLSSLNVDRSSGHPKPHKVCLLLSILDLIESGDLVENRVVITDALRKSFHKNFEKLKKDNDAENLNLPFYHLRGDGIWHFQIKEGKQQEFTELESSPGTPSRARLFDVIDYAYLDPELYDFFISSLARPQVRESLIENLEDLSEQFYRWLLDMGKSERTAKSYVGAISGTISEWAMDANITQQNLISISGYAPFTMVMENLANYSVFQDSDQRGNGMYRAALNSYRNFLSNTYQIGLAEDIDEIMHDTSIDETEKPVYINARVGQGKFRKELINYWDNCAVTGYPAKGLLVASHIKPWKVSNNEERLDKFNGLLLLANLDKAFDLGFISFNETGKIIKSNHLEKPGVLGIRDDMKVVLEEQHQEYMAYHRDFVFESFSR